MLLRERSQAVMPPSARRQVRIAATKTNTRPIAASSQWRARSGSGWLKKSTMTLAPRSWQYGRKANTAMPHRSSTSSESPRIGRPKAPPITVATSTSIAASSATPPSSAAASLRRVKTLLTAVLRGRGEEVVQHLLAGQAALVHFLDPHAVYRPHRSRPALFLRVGQREHIVAGLARLLLGAVGEAVPHFSDVLGVLQA